MYIYFNPNPLGKKTTDCVIRMIACIYGYTWEEAFIYICETAFQMKEMPSSNVVWEEYLKTHGFIKKLLPDTCPDCMTVASFARDFYIGEYICCTGSHVIPVIDGNYYDAWDSGSEVVSYYFERR